MASNIVGLAQSIAKLAATGRDVPPKETGSASGSDFGERVAGAPNEPVFDDAKRKAIQGNIVPGFNKEYQHFLFYKLGRLSQAKRWLHWLAPRITSMDDALAFVRAYRALRDKLGTKDVPLKATWVNVAFSSAGLAKLHPKKEKELEKFGDLSFRQGLDERSEYLGDPSSRKLPGNKHNWVVGGPRKEADILVIVAADDTADLKAQVDLLKARAKEDGLKLLYEQPGRTLPGDLRGHEHFGFKDGVSQPGIRGLASTAPTDFITPRYLAPSDDHARLFAKPGQPLVWPGQFLLGEVRQDTENLYAAAAPAEGTFPKWAAGGSYLVCRRLRQDVRAFLDFVATQAKTLKLPPERFASMLVGRWPSGAPLMRVPRADDNDLARDDMANNYFLFDDNTRPAKLTHPGNVYPEAMADVLGKVCPHFAHIRKVNTRDSATDLGKPGDTLLRMILRRGIPFGEPVIGVKNPSPKLWKQERGLMFLCYQSSIEDQFEFLTRRWSNSAIQPNFGGHDPIIGQHESYGNRERFIDFPHGEKGEKVTRLPINTEWVIPTGGGYFFAPPIPAIAGVLGG